ncbi:beta-ketoacyl-[acyl-carrier-protein] synthase family protein [Gillisia sp. M10.2A]|uniref:Beta-ketoacyl-[acyl-carrier-protein] synthase family protein n=1 Tax=Gillisia lutea TaxID=2909668 RepID=A0ABS9EFG4_9FLAO|nr:beta-ketoacyl-[acyl-carrier-protein] synthase family protein [Gillisia lutea]MCF4101637.1 beta-ketoacyl-[acyl-carrier-protein] synthase family protein [Gillisia lutea]
MEKGIAITGMGIISALGEGVETNLQALLSGNTGLSFPEILNTRHKHLPVGEIKLTNPALAAQLALPELHNFTRAALLGAVAVREALKMAGLQENDLQHTGFISGTSVGGIDFTERYYKEFQQKPEYRKFIQAQHPGFTSTQIADHFRLGGYRTTISTACSSSANAIMLGAKLIKHGKLKRVVVGGTDCLSKFTLNGFNSLMILSSDFCKPFDEDRNGLNLGEGAGYLVLEADDVLDGKPVLARISGYANANDAFHQTASSENGEGAFLAMKNAMISAKLNASEISAVHAHGTATKNNDLSESTALNRVFGDSVPDFRSTKAFTGHTLAAAGGLEAVFSILSLQNNLTFPNLIFVTPIKETGLIPVVHLKEKVLTHVLSNSFGFGGNCSSLIFSKNE